MTIEDCPSCGAEIDSRGLTSHENSKRCRALAKKRDLKRKGYKQVPRHIKEFAELFGYRYKYKKTGISRYDNKTFKEYWVKKEHAEKIKEKIDKDYALVEEKIWIKELKDKGETYVKRGGNIYVEKEPYYELLEEARRLPRYSKKPSLEKVAENDKYVAVNMSESYVNTALVFEKDDKYKGSTMRKRKFKVKNARQMANNEPSELNMVEKSLFSTKGLRVGTLVQKEEANKFIENNKSELVANML